MTDNTFFASLTVRQKGIMTIALVNPIFSRSFLIARLQGLLCLLPGAFFVVARALATLLLHCGATCLKLQPRRGRESTVAVRNALATHCCNSAPTRPLSCNFWSHSFPHVSDMILLLLRLVARRGALTTTTTTTTRFTIHE